MVATAAPRRHGGLIDRRLSSRVTAVRVSLAVAVAVGLVATASVIAQAVLIASIVEHVLLHAAKLHTVSPQLVGLAAASFVRAAALWFGELLGARSAANVTSTLRRDLLHHALDLGPSWLAGERTGELSITATRGIAALEVYVGRHLPQVIVAALAPAAILVWVGFTDPWSALLLGIGTLSMPAAMVWFGRRTGAESQRRWRQLSSLSARFFELIRGLPTLRAFGREAYGRREVAAATDAFRRSTMKTLRLAFLSALAMEFIAGIGVGLVAMVLGLRLLNGGIALATALAVLLVSPEIFLPLRRAGSEFHASAEGRAAAERILSILETPAARRNTSRTTARPACDAVQPPAISIIGIRLTYPHRTSPVLDGFSLAIAPGEHVALVGPSGAGKSTVLSALLGFARPEQGTITIGDIETNLADPSAWRPLLAWVPQLPTFLTATLATNLRIGDPFASTERLRWSIEAVGLAPMVDATPAGLDTPIGEEGLTLSAGERARLALARALLRDAPVMLLDEPVAHLDGGTEAELRDALDTWFEGRTVLVAAHRPELLGRFDRVVTIGGNE